LLYKPCMRGKRRKTTREKRRRNRKKNVGRDIPK
jgi:hypothetical protein